MGVGLGFCSWGEICVLAGLTMASHRARNRNAAQYHCIRHPAPLILIIVPPARVEAPGVAPAFSLQGPFRVLCWPLFCIDTFNCLRQTAARLRAPLWPRTFVFDRSGQCELALWATYRFHPQRDRANRVLLRSLPFQAPEFLS